MNVLWLLKKGSPDWGLKTTGIYYFPVPGGRSPESRCGQARGSSRDVGEEGLFLPLAAPGGSWHSWVCGCGASVSHPIVM